MTSPPVAWALLALSVAMFTGFGALFYSPVTPQSFLGNGNDLTGFWAFPLVSIPAIGALLAIRRPANRVGWASLGAGVAVGASLLGGLVGSLLTNAHHPGGRYLLLLSAFFSTSTSPVLGLLFVILLIFPDGRLPSRRWRWVLGALLAVMACGLLLAVINPTPGDLDSGGAGSDISPLAIRGADGVVNALTVPYNIVLYAMGAMAVASIFVRLRGADSERRHQVRWVAYASGLALVLYVLTSLVPTSPSGPLLALLVVSVIVAGVAVPVAIGIAVLKYRLYDIDLVISRTLVYGSLAVFITAVYVGIAVGIGALIGGGGRPNLALSIVATAIVAAGFQPVRERTQRVANRLVYGNRATPYEVLSQFSERVAGSYAADDVMPRMARVLAEGTGARRADVWLRGETAWRDAAVWPADAPPADPVATTNGTVPVIEGVRLVEVRHQGDLLGALSVTKRGGETLTPVEENLLNHLAGQAGLVLKNVGLTSDLQKRLDDLRASRQRLVTAQDAERRRLERNLHDGAQQHLVAIKVKLGLAEMLMGRDVERATATLAQLKGDADEALETLRDLARGIYPPLLADRGLGAALEGQARKATIPVAVDAEGVGRYSQDVEAAVYFSVLEALQNVQKYAQASLAKVLLREEEGTLRFEVADDGGGFDTGTTPKGSGLTNMADRLDALGGEVTLVSSPGRGTRVCGSLPVVPAGPLP